MPNETLFEKLQIPSSSIAQRPVQHCLLIGGAGQLGEFIQPSIPAQNVKAFDIKHIACTDDFRMARLVRNVIRANIFPDKKLPGGKDTLGQVIILALPESVFIPLLTASRGGRSQMSELLGIPGPGHSRTAVIFCNSIQENAASILETFPGPVLGLHFLFRPDPALRVADQCAIVTATWGKQQHHLYAQAGTFVQKLFTNADIGRVASMTPWQHDELMADIQFLSHSMFLTLAHSLVRLPLIPDSPLVSVIMKTAGRILQGQAHVYCGIARNNPANYDLFTEWRSAMQTIYPDDVIGVIMNVICLTESISKNYGDRFDRMAHGMISTPISRARKELAAMIPEVMPKSIALRMNILPSLDAYATALDSEQNYRVFFQELAGIFKEFPSSPASLAPASQR